MNLSLLTFVMLMEQKHLCIQKILSASGLGKLGSCLQWQSGQSGVKLPQRGAVKVLLTNLSTPDPQKPFLASEVGLTGVNVFAGRGQFHSCSMPYFQASLQ